MALPDLEELSGDWQEYEDHIYQIYLDTVVNGKLTFNELPVRCQFRPETKGKGFSFWHLISEGETEEDRTPDIRRCERIRWISWMINEFETNEQISWWENKRDKNTHVVIWHEAEGYAVILARRRNYYLIKTAYMVKPNRAETFRRERANFWVSRKG